MSNKDLINLGISPDSGTGDTARRGGEKINRLFSDIYTQFGDNPVGQDPDGPFYGYRRPFYEYEYKVGELHPAGRFIPIQFKTTNSRARLYDSEFGWGHKRSGVMHDTDSDGIPDIYRDSEWYFLSRGERIDADLTNCSKDSQVHFVLPIGVPGDTIIVRDGFATWEVDNQQDSDQVKNVHVSFWTTPFEFRSIAQIEEWESKTGVSASQLDSDAIAIDDPISGLALKSNWKKVDAPAEIEAKYPKLDQKFALSRVTDELSGISPTYVVNKRRYQFEFLYTNYEEGWIIRQVALDAADVQASIDNLANRLDKVDSDLSVGLYVSGDSDVRYTVPIFRRGVNNEEIHGNLAFLGDNSNIMTSVDLMGDSDGAGNNLYLYDSDGIERRDSDGNRLAGYHDPITGEWISWKSASPQITAIRFSLANDVKIKDSLTVGGYLSAGMTFTLRGDKERDSDTVLVHFDSESNTFTNRVNINETLTVDSDVYILGQLDVRESSVFRSDVRFLNNVWIEGDSTSIQTESLRVKDNLITLSTNSNNAPLIDTGLIFQRFDATAAPTLPLTHDDTVYNPYLIWNEQNDQFKFGETVTSDSEQILTRDRTYMSLGRGEFVLYDSENTPRIVFEKAYGWPDAVKGSGADLLNPNERPTVEPDYEFHVKANAVFGRDSDDVVVFNSRIASNLVPFGDEQYNLGDSDNKWHDLYLSGNTIYLGAVKIKEQFGRIFVTDSDDNRIDLIGADFTTDNLNVDSDVLIGGNSALFGRLSVGEHASFDSDVNIAGSLKVRGTTTQLLTQNLEVCDNIITLNACQGTPLNDIGIIYQRYDSDQVSIANWNAINVWEESTDAFVWGETSSSGITVDQTTTSKYVTIGSSPAANAPFVFDVSGASDPDGLGRPTFTGDGTALIDGGSF